MTLRFETIRTRVYRICVKDDGTLNKELMKGLKIPDNVIEIYQHLYESNPDLVKDPNYWIIQTIDDAITDFFKENNITKEMLHSVRKIKDPTYSPLKEAEIIYEDGK